MFGSLFKRNSGILLGIACLVFLNGCAVTQCCDIDILDVSQTSDLQSLTYTLRATASGNCDVTGVKVEVKIPISLASTVAPGTSSKHEHRIGRVSDNKATRKTFTVSTAGALVRIKALKAKVIKIGGFSACAGLNF